MAVTPKTTCLWPRKAEEGQGYICINGQWEARDFSALEGQGLWKSALLITQHTLSHAGVLASTASRSRRALTTTKQKRIPAHDHFVVEHGVGHRAPSPPLPAPFPGFYVGSAVVISLFK